jgi:hypothetical protein
MRLNSHIPLKSNLETADLSKGYSSRLPHSYTRYNCTPRSKKQAQQQRRGQQQCSSYCVLAVCCVLCCAVCCVLYQCTNPIDRTKHPMFERRLRPHPFRDETCILYYIQPLYTDNNLLHQKLLFLPIHHVLQMDTLMFPPRQSNLCCWNRQSNLFFLLITNRMLALHLK